MQVFQHWYSTIDQVTTNAYAIVMLVLRQDTWNTVLGNMRHVQVIRQNFMASSMANPACRQLPFTIVTFFLNTQQAPYCFSLGREKDGHGTISWLHMSAVMHNSGTLGRSIGLLAILHIFMSHHQHSG
jgi:hypothetical protein